MISTKNQAFSIYVGCLPYKVTEKAVYTYFSTFGKISEVKIRKRKNGHGCGYGYIMCEDIESYRTILSQEKYLFMNRTLVVQKVLKKQDRIKKHEDLDRRRIQINNVPLSIGKDQINSILESFGKTERISFNNNCYKAAESPETTEVRVTYCTIESSEALLGSDSKLLGGASMVTISDLKTRKLQLKSKQEEGRGNGIQKIEEGNPKNAKRKSTTTSNNTILVPTFNITQINNIKSMIKAPIKTKLTQKVKKRARKYLKKSVLRKVRNNHSSKNLAFSYVRFNRLAF